MDFPEKKKKIFKNLFFHQNFHFFSGRYPTLKFRISLCNFTKMRGQNIPKFHSIGQFLMLKNMVRKFTRNPNFLNFLETKTDINQCILKILVR